MSTWRYRVLLEPRGFIRLMQFILSIVAFATTTSYHENVPYSVACPDTSLSHIIHFPLSYPFRISAEKQEITNCKTNQTSMIQLEGDFSPSAQWFVSVGVFSFLVSLASIIFYVAFESSFRLSHERIVTIGDFVVTCLFAFFWLTAASAWAWGLNQIKIITENSKFQGMKETEFCNDPDVVCTVLAFSTSKLSTSIAFGFLNLFLWISNIWFVYKESPFHPEPGKEMAAEGPAAPPQNTM